MPALTSLHILFLREHNRIATELKTLNPTWNDELLYQHTKRIVNAEHQHIIFNEFLPPLLGQEQMELFGLRPLTNGFSNSYKNDFNPSVTNEFAAAAFRMGHTLVTGVVK